MAYVSGEITVKINFYDLEAEDDSESSVLDAVFPNDWEGELEILNMDVESEDGEDDDEDEY